MGYREHSFRSLRPYRTQSEENQGRKTSKAPTWLAPCLNGRHSCRSVERHLPARLFEGMAWRAVGRLILKLPRYFLPDLASVNAVRSGTSRTGPSSAKKEARRRYLGSSDPEGSRCGCGRHSFFSYSSCWRWIWG